MPGPATAAGQVGKSAGCSRVKYIVPGRDKSLRGRWGRWGKRGKGKAGQEDAKARPGEVTQSKRRFVHSEDEYL